jgi:putative ABC transport system ATP-binding protein
MIRVRDLYKSFDAGARPVHVLEGVDLAVERGEFVALAGRSGSGKSTLLNLIAGLERPDRGSIRVGGTELTSLDERRRTIFRRDSIGIVFQFFNLLPVLSALDNVALPALLAGCPRDAADERALGLLARVGMSERADALPDQLSGGEQQRVATARALINDPAVVLADEPTGNLDSGNAERVLDLLADLAARDRQTILMVTHDPVAAARAQRVLTLSDGRVTEGSPEPAVVSRASVRP